MKLINFDQVSRSDISDSIIRIGVPLEPYATPISILENVDLNIGKKVGAEKCFIDISGLIIEPALFALQAACNDNGQTLLLVKGKRTFPGNIRAIREVVRSSSFGVIIADKNNRAISVHIINIWRDEINSIRCFSDNLSLSIISKDNRAYIPSRTDTTTHFPIDVVYTWVNSDDPDWIDLISPFRNINASDKDRFSQVDELKYSLRSVMVYAPWVRNIYILSNCKRPAWLIHHSRIIWVLHEDVIPKEFLPLFNSHAIETFLHRISGLSENFIYMNDDFMISRLTQKSDFFDHAGRAISRLEPYGAVTKLIDLKQKGFAVEWQSAAINSGRIIEDKFGFLPTRLHRHAPFSLQKSVYKEIEAEFSDEINKTRMARFREHTDVSFTSFFYHHYAAEIGMGIRSTAKSVILNPRNFSSFRENYWGSDTDYFCVNDGSGSSYNADYLVFKKTFLNEAFPVKSPWEDPNE